MKLTTENVEAIFVKSLKDEGNIVEGVSTKAYVTVAEEDVGNVHSMLRDLDDKFRVTGGGGYTFLAMCDNRDGEQWTGMQFNMDKLVMLGLACDAMAYCIEDRELWKALPGGVPYVMIRQHVYEDVPKR